MEKRILPLLLLLMTAVLFSACDRTENFLTRQDGRWEMTSENIRESSDGVLLSDTTYETTRFVIFDQVGSGRYEDANGNQIGTDFVWNYQDDGLEFTQDGESIITTVVESSRKAQRWITVVEENLLGSTYRTEATHELKKAVN